MTRFLRVDGQYEIWFTFPLGCALYTNKERSVVVHKFLCTPGRGPSRRIKQSKNCLPTDRLKKKKKQKGSVCIVRKADDFKQYRHMISNSTDRLAKDSDKLKQTSVVSVSRVCARQRSRR